MAESVGPYMSLSTGLSFFFCECHCVAKIHHLIHEEATSQVAHLPDDVPVSRHQGIPGLCPRCVHTTKQLLVLLSVGPAVLPAPGINMATLMPTVQNVADVRICQTSSEFWSSLMFRAVTSHVARVIVHNDGYLTEGCDEFSEKEVSLRQALRPEKRFAMQTETIWGHCKQPTIGPASPHQLLQLLVLQFFVGLAAACMKISGTALYWNAAALRLHLPPIFMQLRWSGLWCWRPASFHLWPSHYSQQNVVCFTFVYPPAPPVTHHLFCLSWIWVFWRLRFTVFWASAFLETWLPTAAMSKPHIQARRVLYLCMRPGADAPIELHVAVQNSDVAWHCAHLGRSDPFLQHVICIPLERFLQQLLHLLPQVQSHNRPWIHGGCILLPASCLHGNQIRHL